MQLLQVISLLLDYPTDDLAENRQEIVELISKSSLSETCRLGCCTLCSNAFMAT